MTFTVGIRGHYLFNAGYLIYFLTCLGFYLNTGSQNQSNRLPYKHYRSFCLIFYLFSVTVSHNEIEQKQHKVQEIFAILYKIKNNCLLVQRSLSIHTFDSSPSTSLPAKAAATKLTIILALVIYKIFLQFIRRTKPKLFNSN